MEIPSLEMLKEICRVDGYLACFSAFHQALGKILFTE